ncbi:MAG TPA: hypothetical protein GX016_06245 [Firmicutes bacterium]|nr:hypothetical protein [Bacillota bacterium]
MTSLDQGHVHEHPGVTGIAQGTEERHFHRIWGATSYVNGHFHTYQGETSAAIMIGEGYPLTLYG